MKVWLAVLLVAVVTIQVAYGMGNGRGRGQEGPPSNPGNPGRGRQGNRGRLVRPPQSRAPKNKGKAFRLRRLAGRNANIDENGIVTLESRNFSLSLALDSISQYNDREFIKSDDDQESVDNSDDQDTTIPLSTATTGGNPISAASVSTRVTMATGTEVSLDAYVGKEDGSVQLNTRTVPYTMGTLKLNVILSGVVWCDGGEDDNCQSKTADRVCIKLNAATPGSTTLGAGKSNGKRFTCEGDVCQIDFENTVVGFPGGPKNISRLGDLPAGRAWRDTVEVEQEAEDDYVQFRVCFRREANEPNDYVRWYDPQALLDGVDVVGDDSDGGDTSGAPRTLVPWAALLTALVARLL